jgi:hypothetical protein
MQIINAGIEVATLKQLPFALSRRITIDAPFTRAHKNKQP